MVDDNEINSKFFSDNKDFLFSDIKLYDITITNTQKNDDIKDDEKFSKSINIVIPSYESLIKNISLHHYQILFYFLSIPKLLLCRY